MYVLTGDLLTCSWGVPVQLFADTRDTRQHNRNRSKALECWAVGGDGAVGNIEGNELGGREVKEPGELRVTLSDGSSLKVKDKAGNCVLLD